LTEPCRILEESELQQPKKTMVSYIISHDVAISGAKDSDNACTTVIKLKNKPNGTFSKEVVYIKTHRGITLKEQRDFIRELLVRFPKTAKLVIDARGNGQELPNMFDEVWEKRNEKGEVIEYPPLVPDNDQERMKLKNAIPLIRVVTATNDLNNIIYTYMKQCFENKTIKLLVPSTIKDAAYKNNMFKQYKVDKKDNEDNLEVIGQDEFMCHVETDLLVSELSNIRQKLSGYNNVIYEQISSGVKRDRVTSLGYGLLVVREMEEENKLQTKVSIDDYMYFMQAGF